MNSVNFITPYIYLHSEEKFLPVTPDQYLIETNVYRGNTMLNNNVNTVTLQKYAYDGSLKLKSKHKNPKLFWQKYEYDNPDNIPLYYIESKKELTYPDKTSRIYIERIFNVFYGYNESG